MTSEFIKTLKPILIISQISGLINFCCVLESGLLYRDTKLTYYLFLELIRMFVYLICTYHICINMGMNYIFLQFNVIKYWSIVITARISEKWIIKFVNGIIEFDRKLQQHRRLSDDGDDHDYDHDYDHDHDHDDDRDVRGPQQSSPRRSSQRSETFWWTVAFVAAFVYCFACHLNYAVYGTLPDLELSHYTNFAFQSPELIMVVVMISSCFYLGSLGRRFRALNELWTGRLSPAVAAAAAAAATAAAVVRPQPSAAAGALERIRLLHADLSELLRLFGVSYGPVLLVYFVFTFLHAALETYLITIFRDQRVDVGFIPYVFYAQYIVNMTSVVCVTSWVIDKIKIFMHQISIYESNDLTAFGFFKLDLKLIMSILVLLITTFATMLQLKSHPFVYHLKTIIVSQFPNLT